ncbi:uncharacterized protein F4822DRAFT_38126 [Hypoxylon trugodes]|uniref:uncharacterized protein n=1 Tax=Hypoxylon trugodes TaxID=326681 RepID=UPI002191A234|nr:uncharacterized protein F4822DRAFT_38126 [Hypoxylon trugodes]KAI1394130.1 hypothetical protein F4822DRAFT_38126 [Hypoxylon trugodes]
MEGQQPAALEAQSSNSTTQNRPGGGRSSRDNGNRGGRGSRRPRGQQGVQRNEAHLANSSTPTPSDQSSRGSERGRRTTRGIGRGGNRNARRATLAQPRTFGGHLTANIEAGESSTPSPTQLSAGAQEFVPGQSSYGNSNSAPKKQQQAKTNLKPRASKSTASDLSTRIHEDIQNGQYECVICTNEVLPNSKIWSCSICWTVSHMSCVKKWFSNRTRTSDEEQINWRCPGCNSNITEEPSTYHCWCGKEFNPRSIPGLDPHSCGQSCSKPRANCPHPCTLKCHAGPCPPCLAMGPSQPCFCGKNITTKRCSETNYTHGWSCHEICGDLLPCGDHECQKECHPGLCGSCEIPILSFCYCGKEAREIPCEQRGEKKESYNHGQVEGDVPKNDELIENWYWGTFGCENVCDRVFDCGKHRCEKGCHPQDENEARCPLSLDLITHCPCGQTDLADILNQPRETCEDPIPTCGNKCNKPLPCGHSCQFNCHSGPCAPCLQSMEITCRCGRTKVTSVCHQGTIETPECMKICRAQLNCGRHEHGERCCPGEKRAAERVVASKRKNRNAGPANDEIEAEHICTRTCGRDLKCGRHQCEQMCHRGTCPSCPEAIFEEISCNCGRTTLQPPQPCGTEPPECNFACTRPRPCGHPQVSHNCHTDRESCPKCPFLVEKQCVCGKKTLKNQPCWFEEPRCGLPCGRKLKCGSHACRMTCHPGACEDADVPGSRCRQPCGKMRKCGHLDVEPCHSPSSCKEDKPCQAKTFITCDCQRRKREVRCMATAKNPFPSRETLACDEECLRLQRNARLADALDVDPQTYTDDHVPYSDTTLMFYKKSREFAQTYEREFRLFAADPTQKTLRFKPMKSSQRAFLHSLAEDFGFDSESADPEPHRHVVLFKTPRFVSAPTKTLSQSLSIKDSAQRSSAQPLALASENSIVKKPFNALLLSTPQFGLTIEELDSALQKAYAVHPNIKFQTNFLPDDIVIKTSGSWRQQNFEEALKSLKPVVLNIVRSSNLARDVSLCHVDDNLNVTRTDKDQARSEGGWSAVIRRSARPKPAATPVPSSAPLRSGFVALRKEPKKVEQEPIEDDWEAAAEKMDDE